MISRLHNDPIVAAALQRCATEAIHRPGTIQPHGLLIATDDGLVIRHASANVKEFLDVELDQVLGMSLTDLLGDNIRIQLAELLTQHESGQTQSVSIDLDGPSGRRHFGGQSHVHDGLLIIELEPEHGDAAADMFESKFIPLRDRLWALEGKNNLIEYMEEVAFQVASLTAIDRVMVYRFDSQWDGEVIAERLNSEVESFLGHHFPAADIPPQARELYLKNRIRLIANVDATAVEIVPGMNLTTTLPLDLSYSVLRSFSPVHLEYLRNMGVHASLSISLISNGRLWGLIACHHYQDLLLSPQVREMVEFIGRSASLKITGMEQSQREELHKRAEDALAPLAKSIGVQNTERELSRIFSDHGEGLLHVVGATGAVVCINHRKYHIGETPDVAFLNGLTEWLSRLPETSVFATDGLPDSFPEAAACGGVANGLLVTPIDRDMANYMMWFRPEIMQSIKWAGNPVKVVEEVEDGFRISPRKSFAAWVQSYGGHSLKWSHADIELAQDLSIALIRRIVEHRIELTDRRPATELITDEKSVLIELNREFRYQWASVTSANVLGFQPKELHGHPLVDFVFFDDSEAVTRFLIRLMAGESIEQGCTIRHSRKDGRYVWVDLTVDGEQASDAGNIRLIARDVSERQSYSEALERLHQRHHRSADFGHDGLIALNAEHVVLHANDMAHQLLGYTEGSLVGQSYCQTLCLTPHCSARSGPLLMRAVHRAQRHDQPIECTSDHLLHASRQPISVNIWAVRFIEAINKGVAEVVVFRVRDEMHQTSNDDPQRIGIFTTDRNGTIKAVNPAFTQITGFSSDEAIGHTPALIRSSVHSQDFYKAFWKNLSSKHKWQGELWNRRKNGEVYPQLTVVYAVAGVNGQPLHYIALMQDISTTTKVDETAHLLPYHDALTGLPNRTFFEQTVAKTLDESPNTPFAIGFLDLDNFTGINDGLGHITGDRLLYLIATRLSRQLRDHDLVARWGGDKFALMLWNISGESEIKQVLGRFLGGLAQSFSVAGKEVVPVARVGVACYPQDGRDVDTLMHAADTAQTHAKAKGLGSLCFYNAELAETSRLHFELAHELRIGIRERQLFLMYQPQVDAHTGMVVGLEALVRWNHPVRGMVSPANFIPVAEENNQMEELGAEVLRLACAQIAEWRKDMDFSTPVGINVAPQQLKPGFPELIERMMSEYNIPPSLIEIEITESALKPTTEIRAIVSAIKALGVTLAIDDFGTGYSSLSHLKLFPFDRLKIDKSFVDGLPSSVDDIAIGQAIIALGQALKVNVLAEGVECGEQADFLRGEGVHAIQGYFYSRPLAQSDILPFINRVDVAVSIEM